ncbi:hypothetical protein ACFJIX_09070 [Roseateles sp. UC29_93]|uniref:hypothetical protein n=1 Tax=Roseateles sp. UC29_93 TaxID=3350177 RepID=UPI00366F3884
MNAALPLPGVGGHVAVLRATTRPLRRLWWLLLPVAGITGLTSMKSASAAGVAFCIMVAIGLQFVWWLCAGALSMQNHPITARLVPGHLRLLREVGVALFLLIATATGLLLHAVFGHFLLFTMLAGAVLVSFSVALRWPIAWFVIWVFPWIPSALLKDTVVWRETAAVLRGWHEQQPVTQAALAMIALSVILWHLFQDGGPGHLRSWQSARVFSDLMSMKATCATRAARPPAHPFVRLLGKPFTWGLPTWTRHLIRTATPTTDSVAARAEIAAMRNLHWSATVGVAAVIFLALLLAELAVLYWLPAPRAATVLHNALPGASFGVMCALFGPTLSLSAMLRRTRMEQSLLTLVPGMPRGEAMNRVFARRMLTQFLLVLGFGGGGVDADGGARARRLAARPAADGPAFRRHRAARGAAVVAGLVAQASTGSDAGRAAHARRDAGGRTEHRREPVLRDHALACRGDHGTTDRRAGRVAVARGSAHGAVLAGRAARRRLSGRNRRSGRPFRLSAQIGSSV